LLHIGRLTIRRAVVTEGDLAPGVRSPTLSVRDGRIEVAGQVARLPVRLGLRLDGTPGPAVRVESAALGSLTPPRGS
jgi:hypothetical protein